MSAISYRVPARPAVAEIEVKRSRFRCDLQRVGSEDEARALVESLRKSLWDAGHHCSAFVLGPDGATERSSDDGEPAGTAGAPMLEVLRGAGLSDVVAVVTRWFGGTLLGAGGLVRAYSDAVRAAVDEAGVTERRLVVVSTLDTASADAGRLEFELRRRGVQVLDVTWAEAVTMRLGVAPDELGRLAATVAELTQGASTPVECDRCWVDAS